VSERVLIIGAGQAAGQAVDTLVREGARARVALLGAEPHPPYQRPPLSKQVLTGEMAPERTVLRAADWYAGHGVELHLGRRATRLDRAAHAVELDDGRRLEYDRVLLATGARPRRLDLPGAGLDGVHVLRSIEDAQAIRARLGAGARLVVVGGGFIGLEVAAAGVALGAQVTVLEAAPRLLGRVMPEAMARWFERLHRARGVDVRCGVEVQGFAGRSRVSAVQTGDGEVAADVVVVGIGIVPNQELAAEAGLPCDDGILVDEHCQSSDPAVLAAGDCTRHPQPLLGARVRLESVPNAMGQGRVAAARLLGKEASWAELPWFWSDQYDVRLQMAGLSDERDQRVLRGDPDGERFAAFYLRDGVLVAAHVVNDPRTFLACRRRVARLEPADPRRLADPAIPIDEL